MNVLFLHKFFPGQFEHLIRSLSETPSIRPLAICQKFVPEFHAGSYPRCQVLTYQSLSSSLEGGHPYSRRFQSDVCNGEAVARVMLRLKEQGYRPDLIIAHMGWGEAMFCKDVFPEAPLLVYCEFFYHSYGVDVDFDPHESPSMAERWRIRCLNAGQLLQLTAADAGVSPTEWQRGLYPPELRHKIRTIHEGVDLVEFAPDRSSAFVLPDGKVLDRDAEIVTYVARSLEPYRGFHQFMQTVAILQRRRPHVQVLIAGGDDVTYNRQLKSGQSYREKYCAELDIDLSRTHFLGWVSNEAYRRLLQVSSVHVYMTVPFVLSWSLVEAMSTACVVVASATAPVKEVMCHGSNGLLCDFFAPEEFADAICEVLDHPTRMRYLGEQARRDVAEHFNKNLQVSHYETLIADLTGLRLDRLRVKQ